MKTKKKAKRTPTRATRPSKKTPQVRAAEKQPLAKLKGKKDGGPLRVAFARWERGEVRTSEVATELNLSRGKVRKTFKDWAGGREAYAKIMATFAPVIPPKGAPRAKRDPAQLAIVDDAKAKVVNSKKERLRWTLSENLQRAGHDKGRPEYRYTAPNGAIYEEAHALGKADVVFTFEDAGLRPLRLVQVSEASVQRQAKRVATAKSARASRHEAKRAAKRARRVKRKGGK